MKQHHLSAKFLRFYILIGILGFFLITLGGSYMVEKHLEHSLSAALYTEAHNIASNEAVKSNISSSTVDTLQEHLCAISDFQDAVLWIINSNGEIIVSTQKYWRPGSNPTGRIRCFQMGKQLLSDWRVLWFL